VDSNLGVPRRREGQGSIRGASDTRGREGVTSLGERGDVKGEGEEE